MLQNGIRFAKLTTSFCFFSTSDDRELNYMGKNYRFEKIILLHCRNFGQQFTYNSRGSWHTVYAIFLSNNKWDDTTICYQLWSNNCFASYFGRIYSICDTDEHSVSRALYICQNLANSDIFNSDNAAKGSIRKNICS